jgi:hypothetical protein
MTTPRTIECALPTARRQSRRPARHNGTEVMLGRVPRVSRLLALALRLDRLVRTGAIADYGTLARLGHVSRARVSQILSLVQLAPDIQETVLFLPPHRAWPRRHPPAPVASLSSATRLAAPAPSMARARQFHRAGNRPARCRGVGRLGRPEETLKGYIRSQMWNPLVNRLALLTSGYAFEGVRPGT